MADPSDAAALAAVIHDGLRAASAWRAAYPAACLASAVGTHHLQWQRTADTFVPDDALLEDALASAVREAAPTVLAVSRFLAASGIDPGVHLDEEDDAGPLVSPSAASAPPPPAAAKKKTREEEAPSEEASDANEGSGASGGRREGVTVVELCTPSRGHVTGMLLAALLPPRAVAEVVLVDPRWAKKRRTARGDNNESKRSAGVYAASDAKTEGGASDDEVLPTQHLVSTRRPRGVHATSSSAVAPPSYEWPIALSQWRGDTKHAGRASSSLRSLHRALLAANRPGLVVCARDASGVDALRALQLYHAPLTRAAHAVSNPTDTVTAPPAAAMLALTPGEPPDRVAGLKGKLVYRAGPTHRFTARQLWPRRPERDNKGEDAEGEAWKRMTTTTTRERPANGKGGGGGWEEANAATRAAARASFARHLEIGARTRSDADPTASESHPTAIRWRSAGDLVAAWRRCRGRGEAEEEEEEEEEDPFGAVALSVTEQMAAVNAAVHATLERRRLIGPASARRLRVGDVVVVKSHPGRWVGGEYSRHHYVPEPPGPHGVCFEAAVVDGEDGEATAGGVGFIALSAYGGDGASGPLGETDGASGLARGGTTLTAAQVDRLCVLPGSRGAGVKEALLRVADGFHALGLPVRIKTAKEEVTGSFRRCPLLAYEGFRDPSKAGVSKSRGIKPVVVVDRPRLNAADPASTDRPRAPCRWLDGEEGSDESTRDYSREGWRARKPRSTHPVDAGSSPVDAAVSAVRAALNRVAPDTVETAVAAVEAAFARLDDPLAATAAARAAGALLAHRGAREAAFRGVYARLAAGLVGNADFRSAAVEAALGPLLGARAGGGGDALEGAAAFAAALVSTGVIFGDDKDLAAATAATAAAAAAEVEAGKDLSGAAVWSGKVTALPALCALVEGGVEVDAGGDAVLSAAVERTLASVAAPESGLGGRARVLAERALRRLASGATLGEGSRANDPAPEMTNRRVGFASGRGAGRGRGGGRGGAHTRVPSTRRLGAAAMTRAEVHADAAADLGVVIAGAGSVAAVERGMRQGWVFWYVGSPVEVARGEGEPPRRFVFSPEAHAAGNGRFVTCGCAFDGGERPWPTEGLPDG